MLGKRRYISRKTVNAKRLILTAKVRHDAAQKMGDWPPEVDYQEEASNRLKLLWPKAMVVSVAEKAHKMRQV